MVWWTVFHPDMIIIIIIVITVIIIIIIIIIEVFVEAQNLVHRLF